MTVASTSPRDAVKRLVERMLASAPASNIGRRRRRGRRLILAYHNIVEGLPPVGSDRSLHLSLGDFRAHLDAIASAGLEVVALDAMLDADATQVTITFDDAYAGALLNGVPELARRRWPASIFVAPALLGRSEPWWDRLASPDLGGVPPRIREHALWQCAGDEAQILGVAAARGWHCAAGLTHVRIGTERELATALGLHAALTLGAHTFSHPNLAAVTPDRLRHELYAPLAWLRARWPDRTIPWLAYPYGITSGAVRDAVRRAGYTGALLVEGGWYSRGSDSGAVPRYNVPASQSRDGFRARLGGLFR